MKAVISTTYDDKYLFFWPIVAFCWDKLNVGTICFAPESRHYDARQSEKMGLIADMLIRLKLRQVFQFYKFECPEHKEATYSQCSRLYAAALDLPNDEVLITSDVDMAVFRVPPMMDFGFSIFGTDLVPFGQMPMCYISATKHDWQRAFNPAELTYQAALDRLLKDIECENFRGNYWAKDQEEAYRKIKQYQYDGNWLHQFDRARPGTQFANHRVDRDDINWRSYCTPCLMDAHLWRPGYTDENFSNIMELLMTQYPNEDFGWLISYRSEYIKLL